jgi:hypothetical protein
MLTDKMEYFSRKPKSFLTVLGISLSIVLGIIEFLKCHSPYSISCRCT